MFRLILAITIWGAIHSLLASTGVKDWFCRALGNRFMRFYRLLYNFLAVISFLPILFLIVTLPNKPIYQIPLPFSYVMRLAQGIALILLFVAALQTDLFSFAGLRQLFEEEKTGTLITGGLYHVVRHPLYTFGLLILWFSPNMSWNTLVVYSALTIYILVGIIFEERKLLREFGKDYEEYRSATPMLIPGSHYIWNK